MVLNHLATLHDPNLQFDKSGQLAATGKILSDILEQLDQLDFYQQSGPKSLGYEWVSSNLIPLLKVIATLFVTNFWIFFNRGNCFWYQLPQESRCLTVIKEIYL